MFPLFKTKEEPFDPGLVIHTTKPKATPPSEFTKLSRKDRVKRAFEEMPLDARETEAVCALLDEPGSTSVELSRACGWLDARWRTQMLMLCQRRRKYLWPEGMSGDLSNGVIISALAEYDTYEATFTPRRDVVKSLRRAVKHAI